MISNQAKKQPIFVGGRGYNFNSDITLEGSCYLNPSNFFLKIILPFFVYKSSIVLIMEIMDSTKVYRKN